MDLCPSSQARFSRIPTWQTNDYFEMDEPLELEVSRRRLLNVLIHSLLFVEVLGPRQTCHGFLVASDRSVKQGLYCVFQ